MKTTKAKRPSKAELAAKDKTIANLHAGIEAIESKIADNTFPEIADDMYRAVLSQIDWHVKQIQHSLNIIDEPHNNAGALLDEIRTDFTAGLAFVSILRESATCGR